MKVILSIFVFLCSVLAAVGQDYKKGGRVQAKWGEFWTEGTIIEVKGSQYKVHFDGYGSVYDDWFTATQLKSLDTKKAEEKTPAPEQNTAREFVAGSKVEIDYFGRWFPGYVMEVKGDQYKIHYDGYGDNWDTWVTREKLRAAGASANKTTAPATKTTEVKKEEATTKATVSCNFEAPAPNYSNSDGFSTNLAKRNLYNKYNQRVNGTTSAPIKLGISFLSFQALTPYKNTVTVDPARGALRRNSAAPANTMIYPVKSKHIICEQYPTGTTRYQVEGEYDCFKDKDGEWICGSSGTVPPKITQLD